MPILLTGLGVDEPPFPEIESRDTGLDPNGQGSGLAGKVNQIQELGCAKVLEVSFERHLDLPLDALSAQIG
jgi:hypothetical protein